MQPITIKYLPEAQDYVLASRALALRKPGFLILAGVLILGMIASTIILLMPSVSSPGLGNIALLILLVGGVFILYYLFLIPFQLSNAYKKRESMQLEREFTFEDQYVTMKIGSKSGKLSWEKFHKVIDAGSFYLFIYEGNERFYPFIPNRAFEVEGEEEAFLTLLDAKSVKLA